MNEFLDHELYRHPLTPDAGTADRDARHRAAVLAARRRARRHRLADRVRSVADRLES